MIRCAKCSAILPEGARFCPNCGTRVDGNTSPIKGLCERFKTKMLINFFVFGNYFAFFASPYIRKAEKQIDAESAKLLLDKAKTRLYIGLFFSCIINGLILWYAAKFLFKFAQHIQSGFMP